MREKYVEERFPEYYIFGEFGIYKSGYGEIEIPATVEAKRLVNDREEVISFIKKMANAFEKADPDKFSEFWWETSRGSQ